MPADKPVEGLLNSNNTGGSFPRPTPLSSKAQNVSDAQKIGLRASPDSSQSEKAKKEQWVREKESNFKVKHMGIVGVLLWIL
jgi:hypothetical protein